MTSDSKRNNEIAIAVKESLLFYIDMNVIIHSLFKFMSNPTSHKWHLMELDFGADYSDPNNWLNDLFYYLSQYNLLKWKNDEYLNLINSASKENNPCQLLPVRQQVVT